MRLPHSTLVPPLLVSSSFMASTAAASLGIWPCVRGPLGVPARLEPERRFDSCILTHLGQLPSVLELCSKYPSPYMR